ncbi:S8 family serine peptidase [Microcoleus sp. LEGE 07076]|uniref:S8 family serine peptidase n=1 Tax=Microcoleus sp. LEGE 07076 TaxID=915322 RepID=UPI0018811A1B|nr:S8 family serine peptidase [Microcoleus sp. LEGE 07076]MBE9183313.1 S8 family serine peptidase [Microcoleus sp. LEGE 07076]
MSTTSIGNLSDNYISIDFAGKTDPTDTYRFDRLNPGSFRVTAEGFSSGIGMQLLDTQGKVVKDIATDGTNSGTFSIDNLGATNYALKISAPARDTNYQVSLTPDGKVDPLTGLGVTSGFFTTDSTGQVGFDWLHDGGNYQGEVAVFSVQGMEDFDPSSEDFIKESARRALSNSLFGHVVISDPIEGANPLFNGSLGEDNYNGGQYSGPKTFFMKPGEAFAVMLVPNGTVQDVFNNPGAGGDKRPLLSLSSLNPDDAFLSGQIADVTGKGKAFAMEDQRVDQGSDKDYNDLVFNLTGATGKAVSIDKVIDPNKDWTKLDGGKKLIDYVASKQPVPEPPVAVTPPVETTPPAATIPPVPTTPPVTVEPPAATIPPVKTTPPVAVEPPAATIPPVETIPPVTVEPPAATIPPVETIPPVATIPPIEQKFPVERPIALAPPIESKLPVEPPAIEDMPQPIAPESPVEPDLPIIPPPEKRAFIGIIDTGFAPNNPDLDYSQVTLGRDRIDKDSNPLFAAGEGNEHGTFSWGLVSAIQGNDKGIDGYNDKANVYLSRAIGSGEWDLALTDFVGEAKAQKKKNAIALLPLDLTQKNADGSITTRYEFTPRERAALENARQSGVLLVVAAGNDGGVMSVLGQSSQEFENILTVGSSDGFGRSDYSSYGYGLDILVPGGAIENPTLSTVGDDIGQMAGTSASAAIAAGMASKVWESNPDLNPTQIIDILTGSAIDLKEPGWDQETGFGVVNLNKAVQVAKETAPQAYIPTPFSNPTTWGLEGQVTPAEREAQTLNTSGSGRIKYVGWLDSSNSSDRFEFTVNQTVPNFQFSLKFPQGNAALYDSNTILYNSNGTAISTLSYNPALLYDGLFASTPLSPGNYYVVVNKGNQATIDPYEMVLNFTGLSGEVQELNDTITLPRQIIQPPADTQNPPPISIVVQGEIGKKYNSMGGETSWLGKPLNNAISLGNGVIQQNFADGYIIYNGKTAVAYLVGNGKPNVTAPSSQPTANFVSPQNWKAEFINRTPSNAGDINFNLDRKDGQKGVFADIPSRVDVKDLGSQAAQWPVKAKLNVDFGLNSPTNTGKVQADNFGMLASTEVPLESGKTYKLTTKSDDGSAFNLKNLTTGQWIEPKDILVDPTFTDNTDWRNRSYEEPSKTVLFTVPQSGKYQLMFKLYDGTGSARIDAKVEEVFQDKINDISKEWQLEVYKWDQGQTTQPSPDIQTATTAGNGLEYIGRVSAGSNTRPDGTKGTLQDGAWNWGKGSPNHNDPRFPNDKFVMKGVTEADFKANQTYKFTVRADDGYQLYARYQDGTKEPITPDNQWMNAYSSQTIDFIPKKTGTYKVVAYMFENTGDALFDLSWKEVLPPISSGNYYPELSSLTNDRWNQETADNTRFDYGWPDYRDERYLTLDSIEQIYTELSNTIFGRRVPVTAGYLLDPGYRQGIGKWHSGIDMSTPIEETVKVPVGGTIVRGIQETSGNYFIGVRSDDGKLWIYGHLGSVSVPSGRIEAGQIIGRVGSLKHLHLEVQAGPNYLSSQSSNQNTVRNATLNPIKSFWELRNR